MLVMGTYMFSNVEDYWSDLGGIKAVDEVISRGKFKLWRKSITLYDPSKKVPQQDYHSDRAWKVNYLFKKFISISKLFLYFDEKLSIDEQILDVKNRSSIKRKIRCKIHTIGANL